MHYIYKTLQTCFYHIFYRGLGYKIYVWRNDVEFLKLLFMKEHKHIIVVRNFLLNLKHLK